MKPKQALIMILLFVAGCMAMKTRDEAHDFLDHYLADLARLWEDWTQAAWQAAISGRAEDFEAYARADASLDRLHSDSVRYEKIERLLEDEESLCPVTARALELARITFMENQLPPDLIEDMSKRSTRIEQTFNTFRADLDGVNHSNNELLTLLAKERSSSRREAIWSALKQVGKAVAPDLLALAEVRNDAARRMGFKNYWEMKVLLQEHDPEWLSPWNRSKG